MKTFKEILEGSHFVSSADFVITPSGRKVHKYQKISSTDYKTKKEEEPVDLDKVNQDADDQRQSNRQARLDRDDKKRNDKARELQQNEETILDEATDIVEGTVKTSKYSWGTMKHVEHGHSFSIPLHPEHHQAIHKLQDGESHSFTDETKSKWKATREGDKVHFHGTGRGNDGYKTSVSHDSLKESTKQEEQPPFDPDPVKKNPDAKAGKYGQGYSTARHLARMAIAQMAKKQKQGK